MKRDWPALVRAALGPLDLEPARAADIVAAVRPGVLRPPPYRDPAGVLAFVNSKIDRDRAGSITSSSLPDYEDWRRLTSFESVALLSGWTFNVSGLELPERIFGARV